MNFKTPEVSVILPTYNRKLVMEAIQSVLDQSFTDLELIVLDDGSTDGTDEAISTIQDKRLRYFRRDHRGAAAARNYAIKQALGRYIAFQDSDDLWLPEKLAKQMKVFQDEPEIDWVYCSGYFVDSAGARHELSERLSSDREYSLEDFLYGTVRILTPAVILKRSCFEQTGDFDESLKFFEDTDLWFRVLLRYKCRFLNEELVIVRGYSENQFRFNPEFYLDLSFGRWKSRANAVRQFEQEKRSLTIQEKQRALHNSHAQYIKQCTLLGFKSEAKEQLRDYFKTGGRIGPVAIYYLLNHVPGLAIPKIVAALRAAKYRRRNLSMIK